MKKEILDQYLPKSFGKEYVKMNGSAQYPMFVATALGVKPSYDDWIDADTYDQFVEVCKKYDLFVEPDVVFKYSQSTDKKDFVGGKSITTTFAHGSRFRKGVEGKLHLFISLSKEKAIEAKKFGWYNVIVNNRLTNKPFIDHLRFGRCLGFPPCCIEGFRKYNDWKKFSHPFEAYKNTMILGRKKGSYYCNNILMDETYSLIHHLPCSYHCEETITEGKKIEKAIEGVEPRFVEKAQEMLRRVFLVFSERNFIIFEGELTGDTVHYTGAQYHPNPSRREEDIEFIDILDSTNNIELTKESIIIRNDTEIVFEGPRIKEWFLIEFK